MHRANEEASESQKVEKDMPEKHKTNAEAKRRATWRFLFQFSLPKQLWVERENFNKYITCKNRTSIIKVFY